MWSSGNHTIINHRIKSSCAAFDAASDNDATFSPRILSNLRLNCIFIYTYIYKLLQETLHCLRHTSVLNI